MVAFEVPCASVAVSFGEAVVKRVSLCRVAVDWPAEGQAVLIFFFFP